jgi:hypothetical protein
MLAIGLLAAATVLLGILMRHSQLRERKAGLLGSFSAVVRMERHLFALVDTDPEREETFAQLPDNSAFLAHEGSVVVASDLEDQRAKVKVELWDSPPDAPAGEEFRRLGESSTVLLESERIQLVSLMQEPQSDEYELTSAGPFQVHVWVGPQREDPDEELEAYRHFESFVIQLWT